MQIMRVRDQRIMIQFLRNNVADDECGKSVQRELEWSIRRFTQLWQERSVRRPR
jgi:hypothetical protein